MWLVRTPQFEVLAKLLIPNNWFVVSDTDMPLFENLARAMLINLIIPWKVILVVIVLGFLARYLSKGF